jgi:hypothetical protein
LRQIEEADMMPSSYPDPSPNLQADADQSPIPTSLVVVAVLFVIGGVCSVIEVVLSLLHGHVNINFGVLGLFIGPGLLGLRQGWRTCALVFIWIGLIGFPIAALVFLFAAGPLNFAVFGQKIGHAPKLLGILMGAVLFALTLWEYSVLTRSDVRRLFGITGRTGSSSSAGLQHRTPKAGSGRSREQDFWPL